MALDLSNVHAGLRLAYRNVEFETTLVQRDEAYGVVSKIGNMFNVKADADVAEDVAHVYRMALEQARLCEASSPGSAKACIHNALHMLTRDVVESEKVEVIGRRFKKNDVAGLVSHVLDSEDLEIFLKIVEISGANRYLLERVPASQDSCQLTEDYEFKHVSRSVDGTVVMDRSLLLVADAYIENVSEIHKLLEHCGTSKERLIIACRGASDDVNHTLAVNRARGTLFAYVIAFPYDENDANTLVDIAVVAGTDVVSSLKGQLLSTVDPTNLCRVEKAKLRGNLLVVEQPTSNDRVRLHVEQIREKLESCEEGTRRYLEDRLRRLSGATTVIRLRGDLTHAHRSERWDVALRTIQSAHRGVIANEQPEVWGRRDYVPVTSVACAYTFARKLARQLKNLHSFVYVS